MFFRKTKKMAVGIILALFVFSSFAEFIVSAEPAQAQMGVAVISDAVRQVDDIWATIKNGWKIAVMNAAQQAVGYFLRKVAYDSAVWLASGGKGQSPFAHTNSVGSYLKDVGNDAAGAAIDSLGKGFGLDLCKIPDVKVDLALRIGLHYNYGAEPPKPACNLTTFASNWSGAIGSVYNNGVDTSKIFAASLKVEDTDLGINIKATEKVDRLYLQQTDDARATRAEGGGFKAVTGLIDNRIKTPAAVTADEMKANAPNKQNDKSQAQIGAAMGSGAYEIIPSTLSIFLNTLGSQMLKNFRENGMLPFGVGCAKIPGVTGNGNCPAGGAASNPNIVNTELTGRAAAEAVFSEFLTPKITSALDYDILSQLSSGCDADRQHTGLYNCRADQSLVLAIQEAKHGNPSTIAEALNKGWLHGGGKLIPDKNQSANADPRCADNNNYCYSNIVVLRQLGILPLGFEIAAKSSDPDQPVSLQEVVKRFYDCSYKKDLDGNVIGVNYDPVNYPYCHLIDPNWVIKLEQTRCDALGAGQIPLGNSVPDRLQECVDLKTCVGHDDKGNCLGYGYCAREKNVWKFDPDATKCDGQFATCRTFTNSQGTQLSYLYRTLDTGSCNQNNSGCSAYSLNQDANGWTDPQDAKTFESRDSIYLNNKVSACDASAAGCTMFKLVKGPSASNAPGVDSIGKDTATIKKAPDYLNCYDTDAKSSNGITWPQTLAELLKMKPSSECKNYAQVCIASEVGCSNFKNADDADAPVVPGKFLPAQIVNNSVVSWNDQCDARCVGYDAYQEMPTTYSDGNPIAYIIPPSKYNNNQSGLECSVSDNNCTSFTNMEATESGGEKVENFTLLRNCIKPDENKQKNFYTYEGSKQGGYQLQVYTLQKGADGSPLTVFKDIDERAFADQYKCNETLYKSHTSDPDCRQFNDDQGKVYYALLPNTVAVSGDCSQYRLNSSEFTVDGKCFGNGVLKDGACYYYGLPGGVDNNAGASKTCTAEMVSCRAYKGNHGNNIQSISLNPSSTNPIATFETPDSFSIDKGWTVAGGSASLSNESTHVGEHSLELVGANAVLSKSLPALGEDVDKSSAQSFDLTFWAKGTGLNVSVGMNNDISPNVSAGVFTANNTWQVFRFHIKLPASASTTINNLTFTLQGSGSLFLDNVHLVKVSDYIYLVKNSLKIDSICDDEPGDNLPGAALGCSAYTGPQNSLGDTLYYLTNFSYLCRDGAIGCTAFKDTFNKKISDPGPNTYNVFLPVASGGVKAETKIGGATYSCQVEQGQTGCYVNVKGSTPQEIASASVNKAMAPIPSASTYFVPADTSDSSTIYLVAKNDQVDFTCNEVDVGCTYAGKQSVTPAGIKYVTTTIKIDPNQFESFDANNNPQAGTLCQKEAVGCDEYNSSKGPAFFKDPALSGNNICSFHSYTDSVTNKTTQGWFWKGVSVCGSTSTPSVLQLPTKYCTDDTDCSGNNICLPDQKDKQACYPDYKKNGNYFDLWSYGDIGKYKNFVGECPIEQDTCTEFVDHADKDQAYYYLDNGKLTEGDCAGQVSQKAGCVLFDQTDKPNKIYAVTSTYLQSDGVTYDPTADLLKTTKVNPVLTGDLEANRIISVKRDRECAEWLGCAQSHSVWDDKLKVYKEVCDRIGRCDALPVSGQSSSGINCSEFIDGSHEVSNKILTEDIYTRRDVTFRGKDFVGYSVLGAYPLEELGQYSVGTDNDGKDIWRLGKPIPCAGNNCAQNSGGDPFACASITTLPCGKNDSGLCVNQTCLQGPYGGHTDLIKNDSPEQICRSYPENDSPFPSSNLTNNQNFSNVNKCDEIKDTDGPDAQKCECNYTKAVFGSGIIKKYWNYDKPDTGPNGIVASTTMKKGKYNEVPPGICTGGTSDGLGCITDLDCPSGSCQKLKQMVKYVGWSGYCLEYDKSRSINGDKNQHPCSIWLPVDSLVGTRDINSQHPEAGFQPLIDSKYCLAGQFYQKPLAFGRCYDNSLAWILPGCSESDCQALGKTFCSKFPGFKLKDSGGYCGGTALDGSNCNHITTNDCRWDCVPDETTLKTGLWAAVDSSISAQASTIGCQIGLNITNSDIAWTDNIWKDKKNFSLTVKNKAAFYNDRLNFNYSSPQSQFAMLNPDDKFGNALMNVMYCQTGQNFTMPFSNGSCLAPTNKVGLNLTYGPWDADSKPLCTSDASCNGGINGAACTKANGNGKSDKCSRSCRTNQDCSNFVFENFNTQQKESANLGACQDYVPAQGGTPEKLGHCAILAENACIENPQGWYGNVCSGGSQQTCTDQFGNPYDCGQQPQCTSLQSNECKEVQINGGGGSGQCVASKEAGKCNDKSLAVGKTCFADIDCYSNMCLGNACVAIGAGKSQKTFGDKILQKITDAFQEFQQLFAKIDINNFSLFSTDEQLYKKLIDDKNIDPDAVAKLSDITMNADISTIPKVRPVGECSGDKCLEVNEDGFSINGVYDQKVAITAKPYIATARFYMNADPNHMPINKVTIDWGDETQVVPFGAKGIGSFRNQRGATNGTCVKVGIETQGTCKKIENNQVIQEWPDVSCASDNDCRYLDICQSAGTAKDFGTIKGVTCDSGYFEASHPYICKAGGKGWQSICSDVKAFPNGCCEFKPVVQVLDNWGWCNGVCSWGADGTSGCYNGINIGGPNECDQVKSSIDSSKHANTLFKYKVLVPPNKTDQP